MILVPIPVSDNATEMFCCVLQTPVERYHGYKWNRHVVMDLRIMPTESYICTYYIDNHIETSDTRPKRVRLVRLSRFVICTTNVAK